MNTGYKCNKCGSHQVDAHLVKYPTLGLTLILKCRKCKSNEEISLDSYGYEGFEPRKRETVKK